MSINKGQFGDSDDLAEKVTLPVPLSSSDEETSSNCNGSKNGKVVKRKLSKMGNDQYKSVEANETLPPCKQTKMDISLSKDQNFNVQINVGISVAGSSGQDIPVSQKGQGLENMMEKDSSESLSKSVPPQISSAPSQSKKKVNFNSGIKSKPEEAAEKLNVTQVELWKELFKNVLEIEDKKKLLTTADIAVIEEFLKMDIYHQYFLMKLFLHLPTWYNMVRFCSKIKLDQKLSPEEIMKIYKFYKSSIFVDTDLTHLDTDELLSLLMSEDLRQIAYKFNVDIRCRRKPSKMINCLKKNMLEEQLPLTEDLLRKEACKRLGYRLKLKEEVKSSIYKVYVLQTYCNFWYCEDVGNYVKDYAKVVYPTYPVENFTPFGNQKQFLRFYQAVKLQKELNDAFKTKNYDSMRNLCDEAFKNLESIDDDGKWKRYLPEYLQNFSAEYRYISVLKSGIKEYSQLDYNSVKVWLEFLIEHYPTNHALGFWYKQLAHIIFNDIKNYEAAAQIVIKALQFNKKENIVDIELNVIARKIRTRKSYKVCALYCEQITALTEPPIDTSKITKKFIEGYIDPSGTPGRRKSSDGNTNDGGVANFSLRYYLDEEKCEGVHCEGTFIEILFTLLFWDIIYEYYVPLTFISRLQSAPLDMYSDSFYTSRKGEIDSRLGDIASEWPENKLETFLKDNWQNHSHEKCITDLEGLGKELNEILKMFRCIDRRVLSKILGRLVTNYKRFRKGFPNLFLWNAESSKCKFVLAKSGTNSPQPDQIQWIQYLIEEGAEVEVCYVPVKLRLRRWKHLEHMSDEKFCGGQECSVPDHKMLFSALTTLLYLFDNPS